MVTLTVSPLAVEVGCHGLREHLLSPATGRSGIDSDSSGVDHRTVWGGMGGGRRLKWPGQWESRTLVGREVEAVRQPNGKQFSISVAGRARLCVPLLCARAAVSLSTSPGS